MIYFLIFLDGLLKNAISLILMMVHLYQLLLFLLLVLLNPLYFVAGTATFTVDLGGGPGAPAPWTGIASAYSYLQL